jgi:hypothetical protein
MSHYAAPGFVLFVALVVGGLRRTSQIRFGRPLVAALLLALLAAFAAQAYQIVIKSLTPNHFSNRRNAAIEHLLQSGGRHLILVRYGAAHSVHEEWIYNAADIDASAVVFAREIAPDLDRMLMDYYPDRHVHLLDVSAPLITLTPLRAPSSP